MYVIDDLRWQGVDEKKHPAKLPRTYTLTHSDITCKLTLAVSQTINNSQLEGWYNRLQRDEVVAEWKKVKGKMSLHVHCHISGDHFLLDFVARFRYYIFCKELPVVLKAFVHGDGNLLKNYPELEEALVWVYFHSNIQEFNKVDCWGPLKEASSLSSTITYSSSSELGETQMDNTSNCNLDLPQPCQGGSSAGKGLGQSPSGRRFEPQQGHWRHYKPAASPGPRGTNRGGPALKQRDPVGTASRVRKATPENHGKKNNKNNKALN
ncbi:hypothetical protein KY285_009954 [Solanum tuberosum]|nr:hypothetical protein KY285_009954 [Solanum tuberosum]